MLRHMALHGQNFAMFQKHYGIVTPQSSQHQTFGIVGIRRHNNSQSRHLPVQSVIRSGMMSRSGMSDPDTTSHQYRHLQPTAGHVLHLGDLINDFAD